MIFITSSSALLKKLSLLSNVIVSNSTFPIMENFLFELDNNSLKITATDGETTMQTTLEVESSDSGSVTVPSKLITDILKTFTEQPLTFVLKDNQFEIIDDSDNYFIAVESAEEYPDLPELDSISSISVKGSIMADVINNTIFATGNDAMRPIMTGVLFQFESEGSNFVATDAHRLVKYTRNDIVSEETVEFIMPKKSLQILKNELANVDEEISIEYNETNAKFTFENTLLICRLVEGKYPNYDAVIPKETPNVLTINTSLFLNSMKRAALFANKSTNQLKFSFDGNSLEIMAEDVDFSNKADIKLPCDYNGSQMQIGFSSKYFLEMLNNIHSEDTTLEMSTPNKPGILKPVDGLEPGEELLMIVMPVMTA